MVPEQRQQNDDAMGTLKIQSNTPPPTPMSASIVWVPPITNRQAISSAKKARLRPVPAKPVISTHGPVEPFVATPSPWYWGHTSPTSVPGKAPRSRQESDAVPGCAPERSAALP